MQESVLHVVLIEIKAKLLEYISTNAADSDPITLHVLLMGHCDSSLPQALYNSSCILGTQRWKHSQVLVDIFIRRYLPSLQGRSKWQTDGDRLAVDQVVLIDDPQLPEALCPVGKVVE